MTSTGELLDYFAGDSREGGPRTVVVVAHPDDETIGAGSRLAAIDPVALVIVTDGAPRDRWFAAAAGCGDRASYAALRWRELGLALREGGVPEQRARCLGFVDQEAALDLRALTSAARASLLELRPEVVLTHPYEGGHPDHDATAFALHAALQTLSPSQRPTLLELAFYHQAASGPSWGKFAGDPGRAIRVRGAALARKRAMLAQYRSQARVLAAFPLDERLRVAPAYDFTRPPPAPAFHYDSFGWALTGQDFVRRAREAWRSALQSDSAGSSVKE